MSNITPIFLLNQLIFEAQPMTGDLVSVILDLGESTGYAVHATWTGTPTGTLLVSGSNSEEVADFVPVGTQATGGATGKYLLNIEKAHYRYVLVQYTFGSSTGTLTCRVSGKRI